MDSHLWWHLARAGGLMAWWLLAAATGWGLAVSTGILGPRPERTRLLDLHRFLSTLALVFLAGHLVALLLDGWVEIGLLQILVPFTASYRPAALAWGVVGLYLMAAILTSSWLRDRVPYRWWRGIHFAAFALFTVTTLHALSAGTDTVLVRWTSIAVTAPILFLTVYRILIRRRPTPATPAAATVAGAAPHLDQGSRADPNRIDVVVRDLRPVADGVVAVELARGDGMDLPLWQPGAHIDVLLPSGRVRQYSLCGDPRDTNRYRIGVLTAPAGRGGSREVHTLEVGDRLAIRGPRNQFPLVLAEHYLFIAGGIGITPILPMLAAVKAADRDWVLVYSGRALSSMAFTDELRHLDPDRIRLHPADTMGPINLHEALATVPAGTAVYCCGPDPLIGAVERTIEESYPDRHLHLERFTTLPHDSRHDLDFTVELARTGTVHHVPRGQSLLEVVRQAVPEVAASCESGICGTCQLRVLDGIPDHRDSVLPVSQRGRTDIIYPCVSRARTPRIVLDL